MLKIVFHTPQKIIQHGLECEAMHVVCNNAEAFGKYMWLDFGDGKDIIVSSSIKSIEPYQI